MRKITKRAAIIEKHLVALGLAQERARPRGFPIGDRHADNARHGRRRRHAM